MAYLCTVVTVGDTATPLGTGPFTLQNQSDADIFIGGSGVTADAGIQLPASELTLYSIPAPGGSSADPDLYAIVASDTAVLAVLRS